LETGVLPIETTHPLDLGFGISDLGFISIRYHQSQIRN
jgi:hypothetical protein